MCGLPEAGDGAGRAAAAVSSGGGAARAGGRTAWQGEEGPAEARKRWARALEGTWREVERRVAAGAREHDRRRRRGRAQRETEQGDWR
jgi:hypothetical protein